MEKVTFSKEEREKLFPNFAKFHSDDVDIFLHNGKYYMYGDYIKANSFISIYVDEYQHPRWLCSISEPRTEIICICGESSFSCCLGFYETILICNKCKNEFVIHEG